MDSRKFKIEIILSFLLMIGSLETSFSQNQVNIPIYVTTTQPADSSKYAAIKADLVVDFVYERLDTAYQNGYGGFNNLIIGDAVYPIHLEPFDDFNAAIFDIDSNLTVVYTGAQGAIKNEFLLNRNKDFKEFGKQIEISKISREQLSLALDSLTTVWIENLGNQPFTNRFKADETTYYEAYRNYTLLTHLVISQNKTKLTQLNISDFPNMNFDNERYYTTIPEYRDMARAYHLLKLLEQESVRKGRRYIRKLDGYYIGRDLRTFAYQQSTEHHPRADFLFDAAKPRFMPHTRQDKNLYRQSSKNSIGSDFKIPTSYTLDGKIIDANQLKDKKIYFFIYALSDPNLAFNLNRWNQFFAEKRSQENAYFVAWAIDSELSPDLWRKLQLNTQVAGLNLGSQLKDAIKYRNELGLVLIPRVIMVNEQGKVVDPNMELGFNKVKI